MPDAVIRQQRRRRRNKPRIRVQDMQPAVSVVPGAGRAPREPQEAEGGRRAGGVAAEAEDARVRHLRPRVPDRAGARRPHEAPQIRDRSETVAVAGAVAVTVASASNREETE